MVKMAVSIAACILFSFISFFRDSQKKAIIVIDDDEGGDENNKEIDSEEKNLMESISKAITASISSSVALNPTDSSKLVSSSVNSSRKLEDVISKLTSRVGKETLNDIFEKSTGFSQSSESQSNESQSSESQSSGEDELDNALKANVLEIKDAEVISSEETSLSVHSDVVDESISLLGNNEINKETDSVQEDISTTDLSQVERNTVQQKQQNESDNIQKLKLDSDSQKSTDIIETDVELPTSLIETLQKADTPTGLDPQTTFNALQYNDKEKNSDKIADSELNHQTKLKIKRVSRSDLKIKQAVDTLESQPESHPEYHIEPVKSPSPSEKTRRSKSGTSAHTLKKEKPEKLSIDTFIPTIPLPPRRHE